MIEPGLYRHYKNQKLYRVLFTASWWSHGAKLPENAPLYVAAYDDEIGIRTSPADGFFLKALWSGNSDVCPPLDASVVIYVALYSDGRVSARPLREFEERVEAPGGDNGPEYHVLRFERVAL